MVDVRTYEKMHFNASDHDFRADRPSKFDPWPLKKTQNDDLSKELMMLLPSTTFGFNMREKKWGELARRTYTPHWTTVP